MGGAIPESRLLDGPIRSLRPTRKPLRCAFAFAMNRQVVTVAQLDLVHRPSRAISFNLATKRNRCVDADGCILDSGTCIQIPAP